MSFPNLRVTFIFTFFLSFLSSPLVSGHPFGESFAVAVRSGFQQAVYKRKNESLSLGGKSVKYCCTDQCKQKRAKETLQPETTVGQGPQLLLLGNSSSCNLSPTTTTTTAAGAHYP